MTRIGFGRSSMLKKTFLAIAIAAAVTLFSAAFNVIGAASSPGAALTGQVSSQEEGRMAGFLELRILPHGGAHRSVALQRRRTRASLKANENLRAGQHAAASAGAARRARPFPSAAAANGQVRAISEHD